MGNKTLTKPYRKVDTRKDLGGIEAANYNEATGSRKEMIVEPYVIRAVAANELIGQGRMVKVIGTSYTLDLLGQDYDAGRVYNRGELVAQTGSIYRATETGITGTFDTTKWIKVADKVVGPIAIEAGSTVTTGRWHNTVTVQGWLVDDESRIVVSVGNKD